MNHRSNVSVYVSVYIHAQAFSASLKRSLNLSANKHYYYCSEAREAICPKSISVQPEASQSRASSQALIRKRRQPFVANSMVAQIQVGQGRAGVSLSHGHLCLLRHTPVAKMNHRSNVSVYVSVYIHAQAFSASLKRSLNLSANKHFYYYILSDRSSNTVYNLGGHAF